MGAAGGGLKKTLTGGPTCQWCEGGERAGGLRWAGWLLGCAKIKDGLGLVGRAGEKERMGWAVRVEWVRVSFVVFFFFFFFFQFLSLISFQTFTQNLFKVFKPTFKPHNQSKTHAFNMMHNHLVNSKLINYYCIYLKASLIIQIH
jgi:hypothetical protein